MCKFHAEQKSVTSHVKLVKQPMQAPTFLHMIEIDLMDFRKCPCECIESHTWGMNITDHHTKHVTLYPLTAKSGEKVLQALQENCFTYGYPRNILCDKGKKLIKEINKNIDTFCLNNGITIKHGAPRTPQTQGLIERSNRSCKEDLHTCIVSMAGKNVSNWCKYLGEVCYTRNISAPPLRQHPMKQFLASNLTEKCPHLPHNKSFLMTIMTNLKTQMHIWKKAPLKSLKWKTTTKHPKTKDKEKGLKSLKTKPNITKKWYNRVKRNLLRNVNSLKLVM